MFKNIMKSPSVRKMATGLASVAGATAALVASSGVVHAGVREGTVTISTDPNYLMNYSINGDQGPGGQGYQDYMQPIKVNGEIVYCVEPHVLIDSGAQVTNAIPLSQGATLRKPGGSYHVDGKRLIAAAFVDWFLFNGSNSDIDKTIATANATQAGLGDKMRKFRDAIHTLDGGQRLFLMQNFYWVYVSNKQVDIEMNSNASSQLMIDYWNKTLTLGGGPTIDGKQYSYYGVALQLASFYQQMDANGEAPAAYNNDGYILETGGNQQLFSHASFTPKDKPTKPQQPQQPNTVALELYKRSTMGALDIAKSNGKYSVKGAEYALYNMSDVTAGANGQDTIREGAQPAYSVVTGDKGFGRIEGIRPAFYYLKEIKAPAGHQLNPALYILNLNKNELEARNWRDNTYLVPDRYSTDEPIKPEVEPTPGLGTTLTGDKGAKEVEPKQVTLTDTVKYTGLKVGKEYTINGRLMDKATSQELSPAVTATKKFTPTTADGTVDLTFTLDASKLGGKKIVAFEKVSLEGKDVVAHEDINDEGQTVTVKNPPQKPGLGTTLTDDKKAKEVEPKQVTLIDTVKYTNLTVGKEYTVNGRLMDKATNKELEPAVTATKKFTPTSPNGTVELTFTLDASKLGGKKVVAFEKVSQEGKDVVAHEDINDEGQTVTVKNPPQKPGLGTTLTDDKKAKEVEPAQVTLVDVVKYTNLTVGKEYTLNGRLMDKATNKELEPAVTATTKFTPKEANGTVELRFTLDASKLGGKKIVAFEKVSQEGKDVVAHEDINDEGQTVTVKNPPQKPTAKTTLKDDQNAKEVEPKQITLIDTVKYTNLIVGKEYTVSGRLMDKETGKELEPAVTGSTTFVAKEPNGSVDIKFTFDASRLAGKRIVAFEKVSQDGKVVVTHEDINDEDQTVKVKSPNPGLGTTLTDDKQAKEVEPKQVTLVDVVKYTNLTVGKEYTLNGRLMDKATNKELEPAVTATTKFTPTVKDGTVELRFTFDASKLAGKKVVAFEKVSLDGKDVVAHEDINDEGQTVTFKNPPKPESSIKTTLKDDKGAKEVEPKQITLIDTVKYTNLIVGKEYEVSGRLMDKETGKDLEPAVTGFTKFVAKEPNGSVDIKFTLDASRLAGKRIVAFEKVSQDGKVVATHEDINDEDQTVKVKSPNPGLGTTLTDDKKAKEVEPKQVTLIDTVKYTNLTVGKEYTLNGRLMDKATGKELEPAVTASTKFTPIEKDGTVELAFTFDASQLAGKKVVAFEKVSQDGKDVVAHEDINDEGQTVTFKTPNPTAKTTLKDEQGAKEVEPKQVTLIDTVKYTNLIVGKEYEVQGRLMDKETGKELDPAVTGSTKFVAKEPNGSVDIKFTFDASRLAGKRVVAFEKVSQDGKVVVTHEDINDEDQTVKIKNPNPGLGTTLTDDKGAKEVEPAQVTLVDKVQYTNLTVGKEYEVAGRLMDKETGKELDPAVTGSTKFTPKEANGTVDVTFTFDASRLAGKKVVAFEKVTQNGKDVVSHEDINDEGQTVVVKTPEPKIGTTLTDNQGAKEVEPKQVTLVDKVKYTNLIVGKEYTVSGRLMDKAIGKELDPAVTSTTTFKPTEPNGVVEVTFTFDASQLAGKKVVAFEKVAQDGKDVAVHEDINDEDQTVTFKNLKPEIGTTLINKATGDHTAAPDKEVTLVDTVKYKNLEVGKEYEVTGRLMDKATGKEFEPAVTATAKFTPTEPNGSVDVTFTFDASALVGRSVVAFEKVTLNGDVVATHEDINDEGQTVTFTTPEVPTPKETPKTKSTPKTGVMGLDYKAVALGGLALIGIGLGGFAVYRKAHK